jgi:DNA-directed RNA polymerase beta' subunit
MADNIPRRINNIQFGVYSADEIEKLSVVEIFKAETIENGIPVTNGMFDTRMGITERDDKCLTCDLDGSGCNGHFGHINLTVPIFNYMFMKKIKDILNVVCINCSRLIPDIGTNQTTILMNVNKLHRIKKLETVIKSQSLKKCFHCGFIRPTFKLPKGIPKIIYTIIDAGVTRETTLLADNVLVIFERISDEDILILGMDPRYCRPKDLIRTKLLVAPPCVRPAMKRDDNQRSEDDMTVNYVTIIKENNKLREKIKVNPRATYNVNYIDELTIIIAAMIDNSIKKTLKNSKMITGTSKKQFKSIKDRISYKSGRIRQNLQGKRTNNSARTVITPDPTLRISQIGIPLKIAMNLTYPEIVTDYNKEKLYSLIANGPNKYPGAKSYISAGNMKYERRLDFAGKTANDKNTEIILKNGDIVRRHIQDGDPFMFNRQPTLHKVSMMAHRTKVLRVGDTFRMNVTVCKPYNADYDGDEMNEFIPQCDTTVAELEEIALAPKQIIVPGNNKPIMGIVQDALVGISKMTRSDTKLNIYQVMDLMMYIPHFDGQLPEPAVKNKDGQYWTGRQIISMVLPNINMEIFNDDYEPDEPEKHIDTKIIIKNGIIESGVFKKKAVGAGKAGNLVQVIMNDYGSEICDDFLTSLQQIVNKYLLYEGMTMGYSDIILTDETNGKIKEVILEGHQKSQDLIDKVDRGEFIAPLGKSNEEYFEIEMRNNLSYIRDQAGKIAYESLSIKDNNMKTMIDSESKGSKINAGQITAIVGGQDIAAARVDKNMYGSRTLPHCHKYDDSPLYRGFVYHSFLEGLSPEEFFFHAISGREGNIDTAIKSVTGDTAIVITENGKTKRVLIGDWIDNHLENNSENIEHYTEREMELLKTEDQNILIPTTDSKGNVTWGEITAITRHLPGKELYKIKTLGGREVIVTESKSLLIWDSDKQEYLRKDTPLVKVGDYVPTTFKLPELPGIKFTDWYYNKDDLMTLLSCNIEIIKNYIEVTLPKVYKDNIIVNGSYTKINNKSSEFIDIHNMLYNRLGYATFLSKENEDYILEIFENKRFKGSGDTVLDKIISIELVDIKKYPKVYDLTIPSTLNFGLANGMHVVDTADSGYISRKIMKMMEDIRVWYDFTVRNAGNQIIEFMYGSNGIDTIKEEKQKFDTMKMSNDKLVKVYSYDIKELADLLDNKFKVKFDLIGKIDNSNELLISLKSEFIQIQKDRDTLRYMYRDSNNITDMINCPVNVRRIITNCISNFSIDTNKKIRKGSLKLNPIKVINKVSELCEELQYLFVNVYNTDLIDPLMKHNFKNATALMEILIRSQLAIKKIVNEYKLSMEHIDYIINTIKQKYIEAIVNPGEMVGPIAAQSVSEPSTQLTLNTFHSTGIGSKSNTITGIPRIKEILTVTKNIKSPSSMIYLKNIQHKYLNERNKEIATKLVSIRLKNVINVNKTTKFYDPNPVKSVIEEDTKIINDYIKYSVDFQLPDSNVSRWVIRFEINKNELILKQMRMDYIKQKIHEVVPYGLYIICSDDNAQHLIIRVHLIPNKLPDKNKSDELGLIEKYKNKIINETVLRGVNGLTSVDARKRNQDIFVPESGSPESIEEYYIDTDGTNLIDLLGSEYLDSTRVTTNDIREIADVLGIEAARNALYREIKLVLNDINFHHYNLLCDLMSFAGSLTSMDRHGINKLDNGPLGRASFEETLEQFKDAGFYSHIDRVTGASSNIMVSQMMRGGTGMPDVYVDEDYYGIAQDDLEDALA